MAQELRTTEEQKERLRQASAIAKKAESFHKRQLTK